ncbi:hypothetical protein Tco_0826413 [Tanacetum coccineum]
MFRINPFKPSREETIRQHCLRLTAQPRNNTKMIVGPLHLKVAFSGSRFCQKSSLVSDLLKGKNVSTYLYTIKSPLKWPHASPFASCSSNFYQSMVMASTFIYLIWDTINELPKTICFRSSKFKYHKESPWSLMDEQENAKVVFLPPTSSNSNTSRYLSHCHHLEPDNGTEFNKSILKEYFDRVGIFSPRSSVFRNTSTKWSSGTKKSEV